MPWWLLLLRLLLAALLILAVAGPSFNRGGTALSGPGPLLIVLDNGWASGKSLEERRDALDRLLADAEASATPVAFATTAAGGPREDITPAAGGRDPTPDRRRRAAGGSSRTGRPWPAGWPPALPRPSRCASPGWPTASTTARRATLPMS